MYAPSRAPGFPLASQSTRWMRRHARVAFALLLGGPALCLADGTMPFAAPAPAAPFAAPSEGMPLVRVVLALALVLGAVFAAAKLSRRMGVSGSAPTARLEVVAQASLGPRERAVLLRVGGREVLLGVATGNVRLLLDLDSTLDADPAATATGTTPAAAPDGPARPNFRDLLMRSLGR